MTLSKEKRREAASSLEEEIKRIEGQIAVAPDSREKRRLKRQLSEKQNIHRRLLGKYR